MPSQRPKSSSAKRPPSSGVAVAGDVACADFVGRDQVTITYGFCKRDLLTDENEAA